MSAETISTDSLSIRDQFLIIADSVRDLKVDTKDVLPSDDKYKRNAWTVNVVREDNKPYLPPPAHAKLAVVAFYEGKVLSWQGLEEVNFGLIEEGYDWGVKKTDQPQVYEEDYFIDLLGLTQRYLAKPEVICVQAFQSYKVSSAMLAGLDVTGTHLYESDGTNDKRGGGRIESAFGSGSHFS